MEDAILGEEGSDQRVAGLEDGWTGSGGVPIEEVDVPVRRLDRIRGVDLAVNQ